MDLIPTDSAKTKTAGKSGVLWNLKMTFGWNTPIDPTGTVFAGVQGQRILRTIGDMKTTLALMYGGKHDIAILENGSVELKIDFISATESLEGDEPSERSDVLGQSVASTEYDIERERLSKKALLCFSFVLSLSQDVYILLHPP